MRKLFLLSTLSVVLATHVRAEIKLPAMFSDHMVLQQKRVVPVWGWDNAGSPVTVSFAGQTASAIAGPDGKWQVKLRLPGRIVFSSVPTPV